MPFPSGQRQLNGTDCIRTCIAYILDKHPTQVRHIYGGHDKDGAWQIEEYRKYLRERFNLSLQLWRGDAPAAHDWEDALADEQWAGSVGDLRASARLWIDARIVRFGAHSVVCRGNRRVYDPASRTASTTPGSYIGWTLEETT